MTATSGHCCSPPCATSSPIPGRWRKRQELADSAKDMARRLADPATIVQVLNLVEQPLEVPPTLDQRVADATEALSLAETLGDPNHLYWATVYRRISAMAVGNLEITTQCLAQARSLSDRLRQPILMWVTAFHEAAQALLVGDPDRADTLAGEALEIGTECGQPDAISFYGSQLIIVRHQQGRLGEMVPIVEAVAAETGMQGYIAALAAACLDSDQARARALLDEAAATGFDAPMRIGWTETITAFAQVAIELQVSKAAALLFDLFAPYRNQMGFNGLMPLEPMAMYLGSLASVLGRYQEAEAYFIESSEFSDRMGAKFSAARTDLSFGRMLVQRQGPGDAERARHLLTRAHAAAATHGYPGVAKLAEQALGQLT